VCAGDAVKTYPAAETVGVVDFAALGLLLLALLILLPLSSLLLTLLLLFRSLGLLLLPLLLLLRSLSLLLTLLLLLLLLLTLLAPGLLLVLRLSLLFLFRGLGLFFLFVLLRVSRSLDSEQQKQRGRTNDSDWFHGVTSIAPTYAPVNRYKRRVNYQVCTGRNVLRADSPQLVYQLTWIRERE
jgi:hypothetical protein